MSSEARTITWLELMKHQTKFDCWILIDDKVFDVSSYLTEHPGGDDILLRYGGKDGTKGFRDQEHTDYAISLRDQRVVGTIENGDQPAEYIEWAAQEKVANTKFTWDEVAKHNHAGNLWVVIEGKVFDLTKYINLHPGGPAPIVGRAGRDGTLSFQKAGHPPFVMTEREKYQIGIVEGEDKRPAGDNKSKGSLLTITNLLLVLLLAAAVLLFRAPQ